MKYNFRGKRKDNNDWVYGNLLIDGKNSWIINGCEESNEEYITINSWQPIINETIGLQTCFCLHMNGEKMPVFEGDILRVEVDGFYSNEQFCIEYGILEGYVVFFNGIFWIEMKDKTHVTLCELWHNEEFIEIEIMGNIHDGKKNET